MSTSYGLCDLPTELVLHIFNYLNPKEICSLSETCVKFNDIINDSDQLISKLTLCVKYPHDASKFAGDMKKSTRKYRKLKIIRSAKIDDVLFPSQIFENVSSHIRDLEMNWNDYNMAVTEELQIKMLEANVIPERPAVRLELIHTQDRGLGGVLRPSMYRRHQELINFLDNDNEDIPELRINENNGIDTIQRRTTIVQGLRSEVKRKFFIEFAAIIREFTNVEILRLSFVSNMDISSDFGGFQNLSTVQEIYLKKCDHSIYKLLKSCGENVVKLSNIDPLYGFMTLREWSGFDHFLISLENLKELTMKNVQNFFRTDDHSNLSAKFKLEKLKLSRVFFPNQAAAENFFASQDHLKHIDLEIKNEYSPHSQLEEILPTIQFDAILKLIFTNNKSLETVNLHKDNYKLSKCENLKYLTNPNVRTFSYHVTAEDTEVVLFKTLSRNFPNVERIEFNSKGGNTTDNCTCFDDARIFQKARSITIINSTVNALPNIFANNLEYFEFSPGLAGEFIDDYIGGFFHRHRGIKNLVIGTKTLSSLYFFVSFNLCQLIVNFLSELESVTIYNFAEINKSVKLLCTLPKLRTLFVANSQYVQFTKKTIDECEKRLLKVISVNVEAPLMMDSITE